MNPIPDQKKSFELDINREFKKAYDLMENSFLNVFITGKAGTGKSTLLEFFKANTSKNVVVLAPTGVAAINIHGQTIHSFFRFKPDITPENVAKIRMRKAKRALYENIDMIIIDEVSMVRADLLDCIDAFLQLHGKYKGMPFGGVQMIFFGDLYQLPPVVTRNDEEVFRHTYKSPYFFDANSFIFLNLEYIELKKVYRQTEKEFIDLLNAIRNRETNYEHICLLNQRVRQGFEPEDNDFYIYLTSTNALADRINKQHLDALLTRPYHFQGQVDGDFEKKNLPTHEGLDLKFHAQVMLLNNDPEGRWVNGSIGRVVQVQKIEGGSDMIRVELQSGRVVEVNPFTWEMFRFAFNEDTQSIESEMVGSFTQYPLKLAWAITIHKSQGKTFSKVIVDIGHGTFAAGQVYVALSRCTHFEGLILSRPIYKNHILLDKRVGIFMDKISQQEKDCISVKDEKGKKEKVI